MTSLSYKKKPNERDEEEQKINNSRQDEKIKALETQLQISSRQISQLETLVQRQATQLEQSIQSSRDTSRQISQLEAKFNQQTQQNNQSMELYFKKMQELTDQKLQEFLRHITATQDSIGKIVDHMRVGFEPTTIPVVLDEVSDHFNVVIQQINEQFAQARQPLLCQLSIYSIESVPHGVPALYMLSVPTDRLDEFLNKSRYSQIIEVTNRRASIVLFRYGKNQNAFSTEFPDQRVTSQFLHHDVGIVPCEANEKNLANLARWIRANFKLRPLPPALVGSR